MNRIVAAIPLVLAIGAVTALLPVMVGASSTERVVAQATQSASTPRFEVATIRVNTSGGGGGQITAPSGAGRLSITNMPLRQVIEAAYRVQLPSQLMLGPLLAERFKLAVHAERQEMDALALVPARGDSTSSSSIVSSH